MQHRNPSEKAPDWVDHTFSDRVSNSLLCLSIFDFVTPKEALRIGKKIDAWIAKSMISKGSNNASHED